MNGLKENKSIESNKKEKYHENKKLRYIVFGIGIVILIILTILFRITNWDIQITSLFYNPTLPIGERFFLANDQPWEFFYEMEHPFLAITAVIGFVILLVGLFDKKRRDFVRYGLFIIITVAVGAGLIVNVIFKGLWGRPRPRDTFLFPNSTNPSMLPFFKVWDPAFLYGMHGASFPSGHPTTLLCSIAVFFVFNHPEYIVRYFGEFKPWKMKLLKGIKYGFLLLSFVGGLLMGIGRIVQGAHWASDVLWSYGMIYLTTIAFYYLIFRIPKWEKSKMIEQKDQKVHKE